MKFKLCESWDYTVSSKDLYAAIDNSDVEAIKKAAVALLEEGKTFVEGNESATLEAEDLIDCFTDTDDVEEIDYLLDELYTFCDENHILIK